MKLYCIMGKSGAGKDTILNKILASRKDLTPIITYTTRPMRPGEKNGREYYFVTLSVFEKLKNNNSIIEYRKYNTVQGEWYYFMADDNQIDVNSDKKYITINTIFGVRKLREIYGTSVIPIHLYVNDRDRILRCFARETSTNENYVEMCRRFVTDSHDYSSEMFDKFGIPDNRIINESIPKCLKEINKMIK